MKRPRKSLVVFAYAATIAGVTVAVTFWWMVSYTCPPVGQVLFCRDGELLSLSRGRRHETVIEHVPEPLWRLAVLSYSAQSDAVVVNKVSAVNDYGIDGHSMCGGTVLVTGKRGARVSSTRKLGAYGVVNPAYDAWAWYNPCGGQRQILVSSSDGTHRASWTLKGTKRVRTHTGGLPVTVLRWSPDGNALLVGDTDGVIWLWNWRTRSKERVGRGWNPLWSPDGRRVAFNSPREGGRIVALVNRASGRATTLRLDWRGHLAAWSPDGRYLLVRWGTTSFDSTVLYAIRVSDGKAVWRRSVGASNQGELQSQSAIWIP